MDLNSSFYIVDCLYKPIVHVDFCFSYERVFHSYKGVHCKTEIFILFNSPRKQCFRDVEILWMWSLLRRLYSHLGGPWFKGAVLTFGCITVQFSFKYETLLLSSFFLTCQSRTRVLVVVMLSNALSDGPALSLCDCISATEEDKSSSSTPLCAPAQLALLDQFNWLKSLCICFYFSLCLLYLFHSRLIFSFFCWYNGTMTMLSALVKPVPVKHYLLVTLLK